MKHICYSTFILAILGITIGASLGSDPYSSEGIPPKHNYGSIDRSVPLNISFTKVDGDEGKTAVSPSNKKYHQQRTYNSLASKRNNQKTNCCTLYCSTDNNKRNRKNENDWDDYEEPWCFSLFYLGSPCDSSHDSGCSGWYYGDCGGCDCDCSGFDCGD